MISIHTPTNKLQNSIDFYSKLGFKQLADQPVLFTDGKALVEINPDRHARAGIRIYGFHVPQTLKELAHITELQNGLLCADPNGVYIYMTASELPVKFSPEDKCFGVPGNYSGVCIETADLQRSLQFYETLGFTLHGTADSSYVPCSMGDFSIVLMKTQTCPHLFFNPSMTYFNSGKNPEIIASIRGLGIPITEEITVFNKEGIVDNIIIRDPGGYGFFVFND